MLFVNQGFKYWHPESTWVGRFSVSQKEHFHVNMYTRTKKKMQTDELFDQVEELRSKGHEPYAYKWSRSHTASQLQDMYSHLADGEECKEDFVSIAGRIIARRAFGKLAFLTLRDDSGTIQVC